ncbi:13388_t:CDS:2, partial [Racocetra persica]
STNSERVQSYQTASETVDTEKSELDVLNIRKDIYLTNYEVKNVCEQERFIIYQNIKYTMNEFFEILPKDIEFLCKDTHHLIEDIESIYKKIYDDILNLQKKIEHLESFYLKQKFGENCIVNGGVRCIDRVRVDASHQDLYESILVINDDNKESIKETADNTIDADPSKIVEIIEIEAGPLIIVETKSAFEVLLIPEILAEIAFNLSPSDISSFLE